VTTAVALACPMARRYHIPRLTTPRR